MQEQSEPSFREFRLTPSPLKILRGLGGAVSITKALGIFPISLI